jgi:hypothetical protein
VDSAVIEAQEKDLRALRESNSQLKAESERRTSLRGSESDSFGTPELNEGPRPDPGTRGSSSRVSMSGLFRRNNGTRDG